ncbi:hypothetical protein ENUP19_0158G0007 [Entamoeba nuttalli]|uniref:Eukaryotic translation initiation factor 3 subunit 1, putative n=2 Tax=Entamoeba nuttalli TaxID=412467 RepID=K2H3G7_ENTNP|nr:eukaryotic translation initiation factor 3 subunit 1, putative [Entamoeba nuttalli P19]EKE42023.1 eukaryotic translation initiation factor 3 subunit 1, putative [Entamoeba nuttalli P19]|eukprot:XP_008855644.1 eukaryotic translation initiation factor 3 subunit 1, putative [Entamoeba nuttalli P19]
MSWEDFDIAEEPDFGETTSTLAALAPETKEETKTVSNKELKEAKKNNVKVAEEYVDPTEGMTEEEKSLALRRQQEESDIKGAERLYQGVDDLHELDTMSVITDKDFQKYGKLLGLKGHSLYKEKSKQYKLLVKECMRELTNDLTSVEIKELSAYMEVLFNQQVQIEKEADKKKKKGGKKNLAKPATTGKKYTERVEDQLEDDYYDDEDEDDYDFM